MSMAIVCYGTVYHRTINTNNIYLLTVLLTARGNTEKKTSGQRSKLAEVSQEGKKGSER